MAKKSSSAQEHSHNQGGGHNSDKGGEPGNSGGHGQKSKNIKMGRGNNAAGAGSDNLFEGQGKMGGAKSKSGCLPKLFMLLLPLMALGTYFVLRS